nr:copia-type polyprotein [Tanacetum cinerariifolium]
MSIEELQSTLIVHEQKFKKNEKEEEQALRVDSSDNSNLRGRGRGRSSYRGRGRGRGRYSFNKHTIECYNCHKLGHYSYECPNVKEANYSGFDENEEIMLMEDGGVEENRFMAQKEDGSRGLLWFLDSGCSNHMCGNKERFVDLDQNFSTTVKLGNNTRIIVEGKGNMKMFLNGATYVITDVYFVPELKNNLLSIGQLQQKGLSFLFKSGMCKVFHPEKGLVFQSSMSTNRMYPLSENAREITEHKSEECMYSSDDDLAKLWHERLGHISKTSMGTLQLKGMVRDLPNFVADATVCRDCMVGKQTKEAIPRSSSWRAKEILELVHSDICGPITPSSHTGKKYFLSFIDDYSRKGWVYLLSEKSQAFESFKDFKAKVETKTGKVVKALRTDKGGEYLSNEFGRTKEQFAQHWPAATERFVIFFKSGMCKVFHPEKGLVFQSSMSINRMYPLSKDAREITEHKSEECMYSSDDDLAKLWHERLGHISKTSMRTLQLKGMRQGRLSKLSEQTGEENISQMSLEGSVGNMESRGNLLRV